MNMHSDIIKTNAQLTEICQKIRQSTSIAIDTEFHRQKTYYSIPALIQIAFAENNQTTAICIDATLITDWQPLHEALDSIDECIMHSAGQDLEIFDQIFSPWDFSIVDTQIACALLGYDSQVSYANMVESELGIELDKSQTRTNWLQRPLSSKQIEYALHDVDYLLMAWPIIKNKLVQKNRLDWFKHDCSDLVRRHKSNNLVDSAWKKVKGIRNLSRQEFQRARQIAQWREIKAQNCNLPRRWILEDSLILEIAENVDYDINTHRKNKFLDELLSHLNQIISPENLCQHLSINYQQNPLSPKEKATYKSLKQKITETAKNLGIEANVLANRKILETIARGNTDFLDETKWRDQILLTLVEN